MWSVENITWPLTDYRGFRFRVSSEARELMLGLGSGADDEDSQSYNTIDFALNLDDTHCCGQSRPRFEIWENGNRFSDAGTYQVGDVFEVLVNDQGQVEYWIQSQDSTVSGSDLTACNVTNSGGTGTTGYCARKALIQTSTVVPTFPLHIDGSFNDVGGSVVELELIPVVENQFVQLRDSAAGGSCGCCPGDAESTCCGTESESPVCHIVNFRTATGTNGESPGPFTIRDYGLVPESCHNRLGATCTLVVCSENLTMTAGTTNAWFVNTYIDGARAAPVGYCGVDYELGSDCRDSDTRLETDQSNHAVETWNFRPRVTLNPPEGSRSYSDVLNDEPAGTGHARSMLNSDQAWSALTDQGTDQGGGEAWMQIDMGAVRTVRGVVTQGRRDSTESVTHFTVDYSVDGSSWDTVPGGQLVGNTEGGTEAATEVLFPGTITARFVRIVPAVCNTHCSIRAGVLADPPHFYEYIQVPMGSRSQETCEDACAGRLSCKAYEWSANGHCELWNTVPTVVSSAQQLSTGFVELDSNPRGTYCATAAGEQLGTSDNGGDYELANTQSTDCGALCLTTVGCQYFTVRQSHCLLYTGCPGFMTYGGGGDQLVITYAISEQPVYQRCFVKPGEQNHRAEIDDGGCDTPPPSQCTAELAGLGSVFEVHSAANKTYDLAAVPHKALAIEVDLILLTGGGVPGSIFTGYSVYVDEQLVWSTSELNAAELNITNISSIAYRQGCAMVVPIRAEVAHQRDSAVLSLRTAPAAPTLQVGSGGSCLDAGWGQVPLGCSARTDGNFTGHYKTSGDTGAGCIHAMHQLVCSGEGGEGGAGSTVPATAPSEWRPVFRQTFPFLQATAAWVSYNPTDTDAPSFSALSTLESCRDEEGKLHMKIVWPNRSPPNHNEWKQTSNPVTDSTVAGYEPIDIHFTDLAWGGLEYNGEQTLLDGSVNHNYWFYAVGARQRHGGGIPGPDSSVEQVVELYQYCRMVQNATGPWHLAPAGASTCDYGMAASLHNCESAVRTFAAVMEPPTDSFAIDNIRVRALLDGAAQITNNDPIFVAGAKSCLNRCRQTTDCEYFTYTSEGCGSPADELCDSNNHTCVLKSRLSQMGGLVETTEMESVVTPISANSFALSGSALLEDGVIHLTTATGWQSGAAFVRLHDATELVLEYQMYTGDGSGADGQCINIGADDLGGRLAEAGVAQGVALCFDEYGTPSGVDLLYNGESLWQDHSSAAVSMFHDARWHQVVLNISSPTAEFAETTHINFQPPDASVPDGYLMDTGAPYGERGNDMSYGWSCDLQGDSRDRNAAGTRESTFVIADRHGVCAEDNWEIELPNGDYTVVIGYSDPTYAAVTTGCMLEGVSASVGTVSAGSTQEFETQIALLDGLLTLGSGQDFSTCMGFSWIEITPATTGGGTVISFDFDEKFNGSATIHGLSLPHPLYLGFSARTAGANNNHWVRNIGRIAEVRRNRTIDCNAYVERGSTEPSNQIASGSVDAADACMQFYANNGSALGCTAGNFLAEGVCHLCGAGRADADADPRTPCEGCEHGRFSGEGETTCQSCVGMYSSAEPGCVLDLLVSLPGAVPIREGAVGVVDWCFDLRSRPAESVFVGFVALSGPDMLPGQTRAVVRVSPSGVSINASQWNQSRHHCLQLSAQEDHVANRPASIGLHYFVVALNASGFVWPAGGTDLNVTGTIVPPGHLHWAAHIPIEENDYAGVRISESVLLLHELDSSDPEAGFPDLELGFCLESDADSRKLSPDARTLRDCKTLCRNTPGCEAITYYGEHARADWQNKCYLSLGACTNGAAAASTACEYVGGVSSGGSTEFIGRAATRDECVDLVVSLRPEANGASYPTDGSTGCFAELGMMSVVPDGSGPLGCHALDDVRWQFNNVSTHGAPGHTPLCSIVEPDACQSTNRTWAAGAGIYAMANPGGTCADLGIKDSANYSNTNVSGQNASEQDCVTIVIGDGGNRGVQFPVNDSYVCPTVVDRSNWLTNLTHEDHLAHDGDTFATTQAGNAVSVVRTDTGNPDQGWPITLEFPCCRPRPQQCTGNPVLEYAECEIVSLACASSTSCPRAGLNELTRPAASCDSVDSSEIESAVQNPHAISWDSNANGQIQDGGGDMYDGGNAISTSLCSSQLAPWTDSMEPVASDCFGAGGSYMMDIRTSMMLLLAQNTGNSELTFSISGNLGADGSGTHIASQYSSGTLTGYMTSVCAANDPSVNHLFIIDSDVSPGAAHVFSASTDSDSDGVSGIGVGSAILYVLYSSASGHCHSDAEHQAIFSAAADAMMCSTPQQTCQFSQYGAGGVIYRHSAPSTGAIQLSLASKPLAQVNMSVQQLDCNVSQHTWPGVQSVPVHITTDTSTISIAVQPLEFTVLGNRGQLGPAPGAEAGYSGTGLAGAVTISAGESFPDYRGYQKWTVPLSGTYRIEAAGAAGGSSSNAGGGAVMAGDFDLTVGDVLVIVVGQQPGNTVANGNNGDTTANCLGGGGSFVARANGNPLLVAGGGSGSHSSNPGQGGVAGEAASGSYSYAGSSGQGGTSTQAGAGYYSDCDTLGCTGTGYYTTYPQSFMDGGAIGGYYSGTDSYGGFGGGSGGHSGGGMGGGGGYSGGGSDGNGGGGPQGGGSSFNTGSNQVNTAGTVRLCRHVHSMHTAAQAPAETTNLLAAFRTGNRLCQAGR